MVDFFSLMGAPLLAAMILTGIHAYLGFHVIERQVIFVDLSLAQIAALGAAIGVLLGFDLHTWPNYLISLLATFTGAGVFALSRSRRERVPQEAVIGIVYAVSSALAILLLTRAPEGDEHIRHMLVGNILLVTPGEIIRMVILYGLVGFLHWKFRRFFLMISSKPAEAFAQGIAVKKWDLLFYITFGLVVTSSVEIAGVLLVFSFLIVPSVIAMFFSDKLPTRLTLGWGVGFIASGAGIYASYAFDLPTGPSIVCVFGVLFVLAAAIRRCRECRVD